MRRIYFALYQQSQFVNSAVEATLEMPFTRPVVPYTGGDSEPIRLFTRVYKSHPCQVPYDRLLEMSCDKHQMILCAMDQVKLRWDGHHDTVMVDFNLRYAHRQYSLLVIPDSEDEGFYVEIADAAGRRVNLDEVLFTAPCDEFADELGCPQSDFSMTGDDFASIGPMFYVLMKDLEEA